MAGPAQLPQIVRGFLRRPERNEVLQPLVDGKERHALAVALGPERGVKLLGLEAGGEKVPVVHQGVPDSGRGQIGRESGSHTRSVSREPPDSTPNRERTAAPIHPICSTQ